MQLYGTVVLCKLGHRHYSSIYMWNTSICKITSNYGWHREAIGLIEEKIRLAEWTRVARLREQEMCGRQKWGNWRCCNIRRSDWFSSEGFVSQQPLRLPVSALNETTRERCPSNPTRLAHRRTKYKPALIKVWRNAEGSEDSDVPQVVGSIPWEHTGQTYFSNASWIKCKTCKHSQKEHIRCGSELHLTLFQSWIPGGFTGPGWILSGRRSNCQRTDLCIVFGRNI